MPHALERKLIVWFQVVLLTLLADIIISYGAARSLAENARRVSQTHEVLTALDRTFSLLQDAETGQRGFLITGEPPYLEPYKAAVAAVQRQVLELQSTAASSPDLARRLPELSVAIDRKLSELAETIVVRRSAGFDAARRIVLSDSGRARMATIRRLVTEMRAGEERVLAARQVEAARSARQTYTSFVGAGALAAAMFGLFYSQVRRSMRERARMLNEEQGARAQAEEASRLKDEFLATVSHELRTPLNAILGWSRMLRGPHLDDSSRQRGLETIERNAQSQAQLIEDLLDVSRIVSGKLRLDASWVDPAVIVGNAINVLRPAAAAKHIRIDESVATDDARVWGDAERLQQIVWNLLSNAIKFTPAGGRIQMTVSRPPNGVDIAIADNGRGISAEFLPHVFEQFRQQDSSVSRSHSGLGLGLAIARRLAEMHGGSIRAASDGPNRGATFTLSLPITPGAPATHEPDAAVASMRWQPDGRALEGLRVLAVDDEPDSLQVVCEALSRSGARVTGVQTAREAIDAISGDDFDIIVSDIGMPVEDGFHFIGRVRAMEREGRVRGTTPAVALTAYARVEDRLRALGAGYQMHVPKPVEPSELIAAIASLTRKGNSAAAAG